MKPWLPVAFLAIAVAGCEPPAPPPPPYYSVGNQIIGSSGECLDVQGGGAADGTPLILFHCHGSPNQSWAFSNNQIIGPPADSNFGSIRSL